MKVKRKLKRAKSSRIADMLEEEILADFPVTVSENAPCRNPKKEGWIEHTNHNHDYLGFVFHAMTSFPCKEVHIKTATLGGHARVWYR